VAGERLARGGAGLLVVGEAGAVERRLGVVRSLGDLLERVGAEFGARLLEQVGTVGGRDGGHAGGLAALTGEEDGSS
jgi:hypothetical protein